MDTSSSMFPLHLPASAVSTAAACVQSLEEAFRGRKGVRFVADDLAGSGGAVELSVRNGSTLQVSLGDGGLVTTYRPKVNRKEQGEVLHTVAGPAGEADEGGFGLVLRDPAASGTAATSLLDGAQWTVRDAGSDSDDAAAVHVELGCTPSKGELDVTYTVTLRPASMATAVAVRNNGSAPVELTSAVPGHVGRRSDCRKEKPRAPVLDWKVSAAAPPEKRRYQYFITRANWAAPKYTSREQFEKDYFESTGAAASVPVTVVVNPGEEWRGEQVIEHDDL